MNQAVLLSYFTCYVCTLLSVVLFEKFRCTLFDLLSVFSIADDLFAYWQLLLSSIVK